MSPVDDVIEVVIPDEPPDGSVVLAADGRAWQRWGKSWDEVGVPLLGLGAKSWAHLVVDRGPVRVIHRAETA